MIKRKFAHSDFSFEDIEQELGEFENAIQEVTKASKQKKSVKKLKRLKELYN